MNPIEIPPGAKVARPYCRETSIGPPPGHSDIPTMEDCGSLPSLVQAIEAEPIRVYSYWKPTFRELQLLKDGAVIELCAVTWPMVPVSVAVAPVGWLATPSTQPTNLSQCCCSQHGLGGFCPGCAVHSRPDLDRSLEEQQNDEGCDPSGGAKSQT